MVALLLRGLQRPRFCWKRNDWADPFQVETFASSVLSGCGPFAGSTPSFVHHFRRKHSESCHFWPGPQKAPQIEAFCAVLTSGCQEATMPMIMAFGEMPMLSHFWGTGL